MNLKDRYKELKEKPNSYLSFGDTRLDVHMGGLTSKAMHVIAGASKTGKSKLVNSRFVIEPYLDNIAKGLPFNLKCAYYSFEMDKETVQFEFAAYFFFRDHNITTFNYKLITGEVITLYISGRYLQSNLYVDLNKSGKYPKHDGKVEKIDVSEKHEKILFNIIDNRIEPMFKDYIWFQEKRTNPTGIQKDIWNHMVNQGKVIKERYSVTKTREDGSEYTGWKEKIVGYEPNDPNLLQLVVIDHVRKLNEEKGANLMKARIDKMSDYCVRLRNLFSVSFAIIVHTNRQMASVERQKYQGDMLYPSADDIKDSSNMGEDANFVWTVFNPTDERYGLKTHFGNDLSEKRYENVRTLHLVEARTAQCPAHWAYDFNGAQGQFTPLIK